MEILPGYNSFFLIGDFMNKSINNSDNKKKTYSKRNFFDKAITLIPLILIIAVITLLLLNSEIKEYFMSQLESLGRSNIPLIAAFFLGLMTAISPCPLATNITAIAYISKKIGNSKSTLLVSIFYTLGRMIIYIGIAAVIVWIGLSTFSISMILQKYGKIILGPMLLIFGVLMLGIFNLSIGNSSDRLDKIKESLSEKGVIGSLLLGIVFALDFCPISGVFYFGMLIPLALQNSDPILIPSIFAVATSLPVILFSLILVFSFSKIGDVMRKVQLIEKWLRKAVAIIFIIVGIYYIFLI